jgi:erythromycin esterase
MIRTLAVTILFLLLFQLPSYSQVSYNGDFEQLDYFHQVPRLWFSPASPDYTIESDSITTLKGNYALRIKGKQEVPAKTASIVVYQTLQLGWRKDYRTINVSYFVRLKDISDTSGFNHFISPQSCTPFVKKNVSAYTKKWSVDPVNKNWFRLDATATLTETSCKTSMIGFTVAAINDVVVDAISISLDSDPVADLPLPKLVTYGEKEVAFLEKNSIPLFDKTKTGNQYNLNFLKKAVGSSSIVGLGEATHGSSEFFLLRNEIIKYLVDSMGFSVIALESSFVPIMQVNNLVGKVSSKKILDSLFGRIHQTSEMEALFDWVGQKASSGKNIVVAGFDMQGHYYTLQLLANEFRDIDTELSGMMDDLQQFRLKYNYSAGKFDTMYKKVVAMHQVFKLKEKQLSEKIKTTKRLQLIDRYISSLSTAFLQEYLNATAARSRSNTPSNFRDSLMADNISWLRNHYPGEKIIVLAHNAHIKITDDSTRSRPMGSFLKEKWGEAYQSYLFLTAEGEATGYNQRGQAYKYPLQAPAPDTYEFYLGQVSYPAFFLSFQKPLPKSMDLSFLTNLKWRSVGFGGAPTNQFFRQNLTTAGDGFFFLKKTSGSLSFYLR